MCIDPAGIGDHIRNLSVVDVASLSIEPDCRLETDAFGTLVCTSIDMGSTKRTTIRLSDERQQLLEDAAAIVADSPNDDPPRSDVIDAALTHLIESEQNIQDARDEHPPHVIQSIANTSVLALRYRTRVESRWR